jgi:hypothetical protein
MAGPFEVKKNMGVQRHEYKAKGTIAERIEPHDWGPTSRYRIHL